MNEQASSPSSRAKKFTIHSKQSDFDCYYILSVENMCLSASFNNEMAPFEKTFEQLITYIEQIGIFKIHVLAAAACPFQENEENVQKMKFLKNLWLNTEQNVKNFQVH
jgi:hypothetical protein